LLTSLELYPGPAYSIAGHHQKLALYTSGNL
jgi:hypothetical protein